MVHTKQKRLEYKTLEKREKSAERVAEKKITVKAKAEEKQTPQAAGKNNRTIKIHHGKEEKNA